MNSAKAEKLFEYRLEGDEEEKAPTYKLVWFILKRGIVSLHWYAAGLLVAGVQVCLQFLSPIPSAIIVGSILPMVADPEASSYALISCCIAWLVIRIVTEVVNFLYSFLTSEGSFNLLLHLRKRFLNDLEEMSEDDREEIGVGRIYTTYTSDLPSYGQFYSNFLPNLVKNIFLVVATFGVVYLLSTGIFWVLTFVIPIQLFLMSFFRWRIRNLHQQAKITRDEAMGLFNEMLLNNDLIRSFDAQDRLTGRTISKVEEMIAQFRKARNQRILWTVLSTAVVASFTIGIALISGLQVIEGVISLTFYIIINSYARQVLTPLNELIQSFQKIIPLLVGVQWCEEFFGKAEVQAVEDRPETLSHQAYEMQFRGVTFRYPGTPEDASPALEDLSCIAPKGKVTVLCGPSGCGKSTMLKLLRGTLEPGDGQVCIGGKDVTRIDQQSLAGLVAIMSQRISLLSMSILQNAELLSPGSSEQELEKSLRLARILSELEDMDQEIPVKIDDPDQTAIGKFGRFMFGFSRKKVRLKQVRKGLDRMVGPSGNLSGGQQQRVSIGFALLTKCPILLFDEPTSGLDKFTENDLVNTISNLADAERTIVVVSHSLPPFFVLPEDKVHFIFLQEGKVSGEGSRSELLQNCPEFRELARENVRHVLGMNPEDIELLKN